MCINILSLALIVALHLAVASLFPATRPPTPSFLSPLPFVGIYTSLLVRYTPQCSCSRYPLAHTLTFARNHSEVPSLISRTYVFCNRRPSSPPHAPPSILSADAAALAHDPTHTRPPLYFTAHAGFGHRIKYMSLGHHGQPQLKCILTAHKTKTIHIQSNLEFQQVRHR